MASQLGNELKRSKYRLLGLIGQGQFGRVFCAVHRQTGRFVALKSLDHQRFPTHKFLRELRFLLSLQHPNIVTCQALEHTSTGRCLVMDYCEGGTLRNLMSEENRLSLPQSLKLVADILAGLEHAHSRGIVHCDIKPENILLNVEPAGWTARISDFGIARLSQEIASQDFGNTGSPAYMAPERFYGQYSLTSDLYSVGIILFELIAGYRPFSGTPAELMSAHLNQPVKIPDVIPEIWRPIIVTALQKLSARRFRSAGEMLAALRTVAETPGSGSWLDSTATNLPLLTTTVSLPTAFLPSHHKELLRHPVMDLALVDRSSQKQSRQSSSTANSATLTINTPVNFYRAGQNREIVFQIYKDGILPSTDQATQNHPEIWHLAPFRAPIQKLLPRPQGCFVWTQQSLHLIPQGIESNPSLTAQTILSNIHQELITIDPQGKWVAQFRAVSDGGGNLTFRSISNTPSPKAPTPQSICVSLGQRSNHPLQLLALDTHHVAILIDRAKENDSRSCKTREQCGTKLKVYTRRGKPVGSLHLPLQIGQVCQTGVPYQLITTDRQHPETILLIELKPYRILRYRAGIEPKFLASMSWGYIAADEAGQIVCLDRDGVQVGQIATPDPITAIQAVEPYGLLVATWTGEQGHLYLVDLREADVELLF